MKGVGAIAISVGWSEFCGSTSVYAYGASWLQVLTHSPSKHSSRHSVHFEVEFLLTMYFIPVPSEPQVLNTARLGLGLGLGLGGQYCTATGVEWG